MASIDIQLRDFVASLATSPLAPWAACAPWEITCQSEAIVRRLLETLTVSDYVIHDEIAVHRSAIVESGAVLKGPLILGPNGFIASVAYLRGGNWLSAACSVGPGAELKSSFVFSGTRLAHFNFVGDSILGSDVNLEAGSIVCNHRNERTDKEILVRVGGELHRTGHVKFGAVLGDGCRLGANAVVAPGCLLHPKSVVDRVSLRDDEVLGRTRGT